MNSEALKLVQEADTVLHNNMARRISRLVCRIVFSRCDYSERQVSDRKVSPRLSSETCNVPLFFDSFPGFRTLNCGNLIHCSQLFAVFINGCSAADETVCFLIWVLIDKVDLEDNDISLTSPCKQTIQRSTYLFNSKRVIVHIFWESFGIGNAFQQELGRSSIQV